MTNPDYQTVARLIKEKGNVAALTGAGISVDSGIPDFRSRGGLWEKFDPEEYATIYAFKANPKKVWKLFFEVGRILEKALPNKSHVSIATLEEMDYLKGIITQNIDHLHQKAGSKQVLEFHGNHQKLKCISCSKIYPFESFDISEENIPVCSCGMILKPDVVLFGEPIDPVIMHDSIHLSETCSIMLVCGTSGIVYPAASMPFIAKQNGAIIIEFNLEETQITGIADFSFQGKTSETLPQLVDKIGCNLK